MLTGMSLVGTSGPSSAKCIKIAVQTSGRESSLTGDVRSMPCAPFIILGTSNYAVSASAKPHYVVDFRCCMANMYCMKYRRGSAQI